MHDPSLLLLIFDKEFNIYSLPVQSSAATSTEEPVLDPDKVSISLRTDFAHALNISLTIQNSFAAGRVLSLIQTTIGSAKYALLRVPWKHFA